MAETPLTPRMRVALRALLDGDDLNFATSCVGRPTKQRLAKHGLAVYLTPKDWDGPMRITPAGARLVKREVKRA